MNRRMIFSVGAILCSVSLVGCAAASAAAAVATNPVPANIASTAGPAAFSSDPVALACSAGSTSASLTPEVTEGPFFKHNSPERTAVADANTPGTKLVLTGTVYTPDCKPVPHALLDFWQADASGMYDNQGYNLRGRQYTDANGHYQLTTIIPGLYTGRTEHIHAKVQAPNGPVVTTQLFFPGVAQNDMDGIFDPALLIVMQKGSAGDLGQYNFVVPGQ